MDYHLEVMKNCPNFETDTLKEKLSLGGLGVAGEAGEVADLVKKILHHNVAFTDEVRTELVKEMGDVYWYLEYLCASLEVSRSDVMIANIEKLKIRHPEGWTPESQQAKLDER